MLKTKGGYYYYYHYHSDSDDYDYYHCFYDYYYSTNVGGFRKVDDSVS